MGPLDDVPLAVGASDGDHYDPGKTLWPNLRIS